MSHVSRASHIDDRMYENVAINLYDIWRISYLYIPFVACASPIACSELISSHKSCCVRKSSRFRSAARMYFLLKNQSQDLNRKNDNGSMTRENRCEVGSSVILNYPFAEAEVGRPSSSPNSPLQR